jgi:hypothetical protein
MDTRQRRQYVANAPFPSSEFDPTTKGALAKAGTVTFPWPPPASGPLYLGINPDSNPDLPSGSPPFFLRVVQNVSPKQVVTRIVALDELRGISLPDAAAKPAGSSRTFQTVNGIAQQIADAKTSLINANRQQTGVYEVLLFDDAIIYVGEDAPAVVRVLYGVPAGDAAENVGQLTRPQSCCHKPPLCDI